MSTVQLLLAIAGEGRDHETLRQDALDPARQRSALFAMGFSGSIQFVDSILQLMREPGLAALAGEALAGITGVNIEKDGLKAKDPPAQPAGEKTDSPELDDLDADLSLTADEDLTVPDPDAAMEWWKKHRDSFNPRTRYINGLPFEGERTLLQALVLAPMRRRHALALDLAIRSQGNLLIETRGLARHQLRYLPSEWQAAAQRTPGINAARTTHG